MKLDYRRLYSYIKDKKLSLMSIGILKYLSLHDGEQMKNSNILEDLQIQMNTLKAHVHRMEGLNIIERQVTRRGIVYSVCKPNLWVPNGYINLSSINNKYNKTIKEILEDLNRIARREGTRRYRAEDDIRARLKDGRTVAEFKKIHRNMAHWIDDEKMSVYFRPETLYRKKNFEKYLMYEHRDNSKRTTSKWKDPEVQEKVAGRKKRFEELYSED